jgi:hypothetical protein
MRRLQQRSTHPLQQAHRGNFLRAMLPCHRFVWGKKIERDLMMGKDVKEFTAAAVQRKHEERMVSSSSSSSSWKRHFEQQQEAAG